MKSILGVILIFFVLSCKKENTSTLPPLSIDADNYRIEGNITWPDDSITHFSKLSPAVFPDNSAIFSLDTVWEPGGDSLIFIYGGNVDTILQISIKNPNINKPGVYNFQDLDSNHLVLISFQSGYGYGGYPPEIAYFGTSYANMGQLTIDSISEKRIVGSINAWLNKQSLISSPSDSNDVYISFQFSGNLFRH